ncbi:MULTISPECIES: hypothetical protein [Staphylococcus]|nr:MULTISPECIES: hypothetical protein [Staphylococcus]MCQ9294547.1 hypothetical protein [Staphylococcus cohnii]MDQ7109322.1 hypothetical protein [Staphylococcus ureilyticus]MDU9372316.1 hypothetical protein [Staphylococcus ureilyticus]
MLSNTLKNVSRDTMKFDERLDLQLQQGASIDKATFARLMDS